MIFAHIDLLNFVIPSEDRVGTGASPVQPSAARRIFDFRMRLGITSLPSVK
jgi:hypothetical protein